MFPMERWHIPDYMDARDQGAVVASILTTPADKNKRAI